MMDDPKNELMRLDVVGVHDETPVICSFERAAPDGSELSSFSAGAHIIVHLPGGHAIILTSRCLAQLNRLERPPHNAS